jgi:hypothetical protein
MGEIAADQIDVHVQSDTMDRYVRIQYARPCAKTVGTAPLRTFALVQWVTMGRCARTPFVRQHARMVVTVLDRISAPAHLVTVDRHVGVPYVYPRV